MAMPHTLPKCAMMQTVPGCAYFCVFVGQGWGRHPEEKEQWLNRTRSSNDSFFFFKRLKYLNIFFVSFSVFVSFSFSFVSISLCSSSWPRTYYVNLAGL